VTQLAHDAVMLRIPFSVDRLYDGDDPNYATWLGALVERVSATRRAENRKADQQSKGSKSGG
jgi:hypothetical protein